MFIARSLFTSACLTLGCGAAAATSGTCPADLVEDGVLDFFDVAYFLSAYTNMDPEGDWNGDGQWDYFDINAFLADFEAGCP